MTTATAVASDQIAPNQTLYVNNLDEKIKLPELKKQLYTIFSEHGPVVEIIAAKSLRKRGQAFVVYADIEHSTQALRKCQAFTLNGKPMRIAYARVKSDIISKKDGSFVPRDKRKQAAEAKERAAAAMEGGARKKLATAAGPVPIAEDNPPHNVLFVQNLPAGAPEEMLRALFEECAGLVDCRLVPGRPGIAFIDFETDGQAAAAMNVLQGFKVTSKNPLVISFARK